MKKENFSDFTNGQNRQKYEVYAEKSASLSPLFKGAEDFMRTDAKVENELREIIKIKQIKISKEDLDSLLRVGLGENGAHFIMTLDGVYIDIGDKVLFQPMTKTSMEGRGKNGDVWLSSTEIEGFRKRYPFDQLKRAFDEALLETEHAVIDGMLEDDLKDKK